MTLKDFLSRNSGVYKKEINEGCVLVAANVPELYRLSDYIVSSVSCGQCYMIRKVKPIKELEN